MDSFPKISSDYRVGFRHWWIDRYVDEDLANPFHVEPEEKPTLKGNNRAQWTLAEPGHTTAECLPNRALRTVAGSWGPQSCDYPPQRSCSCGLYASHLPQRENSFGAATGMTGQAYGAVVGWGRRFRHGEEGFRAEYMKPVAFWIPPLKTYQRPAPSHVELIVEIADMLGARIFRRMDEVARYAFSIGSTWHPLGQQAVDEYFGKRRWSRGVHDALR